VLTRHARRDGSKAPSRRVAVVDANGSWRELGDIDGDLCRSAIKPFQLAAAGDRLPTIRIGRAEDRTRLRFTYGEPQHNRWSGLLARIAARQPI